MKAILITMLLLAVSSIASAVNPEAGKQISVLCIGCHGENGNSEATHYPRLAGQHENYLAKQLKDFKSGTRKEEHMTSMVEAISQNDIVNLSAWFSRQKIKSRSGKKINLKGKKIYQQGISDKNVSPCADCHGEKGMGNNDIGFPLLAGQHAEYIEKQLQHFRHAKRRNDNRVMQSIVGALSDEEIRALATYIESMNSSL